MQAFRTAFGVARVGFAIGRRFASSAAAATTTAVAAAVRVAEIAAQPQHAPAVADALRMHKLFEMYRSLPVQHVHEDAGALADAGQDIGAYVRERVAAERTRAQPPWFFPTHLLPEPQHIPKGTKLEFSYKYKYEFVKSGQEPGINRVCRMRAKVADLGLATADERSVFARLMGPRIVNGMVLIAARSRPTRRENEVLALFQLDSSLAAAKEIAARLAATDVATMTAEQIAAIEAALPEPPIKSRNSEEEDETDTSTRMKRVEEVVEVFGDQVEAIYDKDVFAATSMTEKVSNAMQAQRQAKFTAKLAAKSASAAASSASSLAPTEIDEDDEDDDLDMEAALANMSSEQVAATFAEIEATIKRLENADTLSAEDEALAAEMSIVTKKEAKARAAAAAAKAAAEEAAAEEGNKVGGKKQTAPKDAKSGAKAATATSGGSKDAKNGKK